MELKYAGLKPIISEHGISFKDGKEDKYKYLKYAAEILEAIDHDYETKTKYTHNLKDMRLNADEILKILLKYHPNLEETMNKELHTYEKHLNEEEEEVKDRTNLNDLEKSAFINNLKIMRDYKIQRAKNKIFYFHCIHTIVEIIIQNEIKEIDTPLVKDFGIFFKQFKGSYLIIKSVVT